MKWIATFVDVKHRLSRYRRKYPQNEETEVMKKTFFQKSAEIFVAQNF